VKCVVCFGCKAVVIVTVPLWLQDSYLNATTSTIAATEKFHIDVTTYKRKKKITHTDTPSCILFLLF
jgi:hypothetical protein